MTTGIKRVLGLEQVTQCAVLEEFDIFLVLADKARGSDHPSEGLLTRCNPQALYAYHLNTLITFSDSEMTLNSPGGPQKLNGTNDVEFFSIGIINGRTLISYLKKRSLVSMLFLDLDVVGR